MLDQEGSSSSVASLGHSPVQSQKQRRGADYTSVPVLERTLDDDEEADSSIIEDYDNDSLALEPQGTLFSSYLNITNTILGTGMLAMPSALAGVGFGLGIFLIFLSGFASSFGLFLLTQVAAKVGRNSSFFTCSKLTYPSGAVFFDLAIAIKCFGVSVSYLVICGGLV